MRIRKFSLTLFAVFVLFGMTCAGAWAAAPPAVDPTTAGSSSHSLNVPSVNDVMTVTWEKVVDPDGDLLGYVTEWSESAALTPVTVGLSPEFASTNSGSRADGTWYFYIRAVDKQGNYSAVTRLGPYLIDTSPEIIDISPSSGSNSQTTNVTIHGTSFQSSATVRIGSTTLTGIVVGSDQSITAIVPAGIAAGTYDIVVTNPNTKSYTFSASDQNQGGFTVTSSNSAPTLSITPDATERKLINTAYSIAATLTDTDGDTMSATWTATSVPAEATTSDYTISTVNFTNVASGSNISTQFTGGKAGVYTLKLTVTDSKLASASKTVDITLNSNTNTTPAVTATATAASPYTPTTGTLNVPISTEVTVYGSVTDPDALDSHTYVWTLSKPTGSASTLANAATLTATFTPDTAGNYVASFTATDAAGATSAADTVTIKANAPPTANAGADQNVETNKLATVSGATSSDLNAGTTLTYDWKFTAAADGRALSTTVATAAAYAFTPTADGGYTLVLTVDDKSGLPNATATDTVVITASTNPPPKADAGPLQNVIDTGIAKEITVTSSGTNDPTVEALTYNWEFTAVPTNSAKSTGTSVSTNSSYTFATEPGISGTYRLQLTVTDTASQSSTDTVDINVSPAYVKGDVNGDGEITAQDAVDAFWLSFNTSWTSDQLNKADYNRDSEVTSQDAVDIFWASF